MKKLFILIFFFILSGCNNNLHTKNNLKTPDISPIVVGINGYTLLPEEKALIIKNKPAGIILFKNNCKTEQQLKNLIADIKSTKKYYKSTYLPFICIDIEGKSINRLKEMMPLDKDARDFSEPKEVYSYYSKIAKYIKKLGIDIVFSPVTDVSKKENTSALIGIRSFSNDPKIVARLSYEVVKAYQDNGIIPVMKHLPGHGSSNVDSHEELPIIRKEIAKLYKEDFESSKLLVNYIRKDERPSVPCMTGHVLFTNIDKKFPSTLSKHIIKDIIRKYIGIGEDIIFSDSFEMKALKNYKNPINKFFKAGGDIALICSNISKIDTNIPPQKNISKKLEKLFMEYNY